MSEPPSYMDGPLLMGPDVYPDSPVPGMQWLTLRDGRMRGSGDCDSATPNTDSRKEPMCHKKADRHKHPERIRAAKREWYRKDPKRYVEGDRARYLQYKYGITVEEYDAMLVQQEHGCAICGGQNTGGRNLAVDHDHETGRVRGLLCNPCNTALGVLEKLLEEAMEYLVLAS